MLFWLIISEVCPKLLPSVSHSLGLEGMFSCVTRTVFNLEFSPNLFCWKFSSGVIIFFWLDASGPKYLFQFSWCLSNWLPTPQVLWKVACERPSVLRDPVEMLSCRCDGLASGLVFQSEKKSEVQKSPIPSCWNRLLQQEWGNERNINYTWFCFAISPIVRREDPQWRKGRERRSDSADHRARGYGKSRMRKPLKEDWLGSKGISEHEKVKHRHKWNKTIVCLARSCMFFMLPAHFTNHPQICLPTTANSQFL